MSTRQAPARNAAVVTQASSARAQDKRPAPANIAPESAFGAAVKNRRALGAGGMLALQAAAGNRAVAGLVQAKRGTSSADEHARVHEAARVGIGGTGEALPHLEKIQQSFGRHDVTGVVAHTGAQATAGAQAMGAAAFTKGNHVAFAGTADLRTAAHEAAHVVQQRAGVQLAGGVGQVGDRYERHADAVAGLVVQGRSAEKVLDAYAVPVADAPRSGATSEGRSGLQRTGNEHAGGSAPVQLITKWGLLGLAGAAAAGVGVLASAPVLGAAVGVGLAGAGLLGRYLSTPSTQAPKGTPKLSEKDQQALSEFRTKNKVAPLSVHLDAAFTDEVAGRRREPNAYRQWQLGGVGAEGRAVGRDGKPLPAGRYIYVVTVGNEFRYLPTKETNKDHFDQYRTHSQLAGKQNVFAAGAFMVDDGHFITQIDNESGHYQPPHEGHAQYAAEVLARMGLKKPTQTRAHDATHDPRGVAYLKGQVKANLRAAKTWVPGTKKHGWEFGFPEPEPALKRDLPF